MAWNEPGRSGEKDPWGGQRKKPGEGPPDLDQILRNLQEKLRALFPAARVVRVLRPDKGVPAEVV